MAEPDGVDGNDPLDREAGESAALEIPNFAAEASRCGSPTSEAVESSAYCRLAWA